MPQMPVVNVGTAELPLLDPKSISPEEYIAAFRAFFLGADEGKYLEAIHDDIMSQCGANADCKHYGLEVSACDLIHFDSALSYLLLHHPALLVPLMEETLAKVQEDVLEEIKRNSRQRQPSQSPTAITVKKHTHVRIVDLNPLSELCKPNISSIRNTDLGKIIRVQGTVIRTAAIKLLENSKEYQCQNRTCSKRFLVYCDMSEGNQLLPPKSCKGGTRDRPCKSTRFAEVGSPHYSDYQEIKIQEQAQRLSVGSIPRSIVVLLMDDLVDCCKPGDDVVVVGSLMNRWSPLFPEARISVEVCIEANSVTVNNGVSSGSGDVSKELALEFAEMWRKGQGTPLRVRNELVASVCPQVYGLFTVKLAVLLTMIGGVSEVDNQGMKMRGTSHLLLIGDPGTGKSQFLRFAARLCPRSVLTTGVGTTSAGLTCTATKESGEWMLEAGALVLADRGVCCIDEFSAIKEHDRATIHEAMEQQTLSVAKAGLVCKLNTRTTVFAVANPKGTYDTSEDITTNTAIGGPLLSRFDLVLLLLDTKNAEWDEMVSCFVFREAMGTGKASKSRARSDRPSSGAWKVAKLQKYITWAKDQAPAVKLSKDASEVLTRYYHSQRGSDQRSKARTTIRLLESLVRLAQAHARLMARQTATLQDAIVSVLCIETSLHSSAMLGLGSALHSDFPADPDEEFRIQQQLVLDRLQLPFGSEAHLVR
ncbi:unnamed protein product [Chrysoparadoxa australica]